MYAIYGNIYHQYTPDVSRYTSTMDPMGNKIISPGSAYFGIFQSCAGKLWGSWAVCFTLSRAPSELSQADLG